MALPKFYATHRNYEILSGKSLVPIGDPGSGKSYPGTSGFRIRNTEGIRLVISLLPVYELGLGHGRLLHPQLRVLQI
jgi:hypothetical protein